MSHARKTILAALVTQVTAQATDFTLVSSSPEHYHSEGVAAGERPTCVIRDMSSRAGDWVSKHQEFYMTVIMRVFADGDTTDDELRDLHEALVDAINSDITIGGTCLCVYWRTADPPYIWPKDEEKVMDTYFDVRYRRDMP